MHSRIHEADKIINGNRKFGADPCYYPALLVLPNGDEEVLLLTNEQINTARQRATFNPEECDAMLASAAAAEKRIGLILLAVIASAALLGAAIAAVWS